jgi:putative SOS response-associated peptidase YedK
LLNSEQPYAFAGLWEWWTGAEGEELETCTILTTQANEVVSPVHERMPVIIEPADYDLWLDCETGHASDVRSLLRSYPAALMSSHPVSKRVNDVRNDDAECTAQSKLSALDQSGGRRA